MNKTTLKLGYWSAIISASIFIIWIICFAGIVLTSPLFYWTNFSDYQNFVNSNSQFFQYFAKSFMLVFALSYLVLLLCLHELAPANKKILTQIGVVFGLIFSILTSIHYYVQISTVRFAFNNEEFEGIEHLLQANPTSVMSSINMLGWTLFLGLSSLFMYSAFGRNELNKVIKLAFLINGISCLLAGLGYLAQIDIITFVFINLGVGGAILTKTIATSRLFKKLCKSLE